MRVISRTDFTNRVLRLAVGSCLGVYRHEKIKSLRFHDHVVLDQGNNLKKIVDGLPSVAENEYATELV